MTSPWLLPEEACSYLRMTAPASVVHFNFLCRKGRIKARKVAGKWQTRQEWLDQVDENPRKRR
jgi:hypothetical protein